MKDQPKVGRGGQAVVLPQPDGNKVSVQVTPAGIRAHHHLLDGDGPTPNGHQMFGFLFHRKAIVNTAYSYYSASKMFDMLLGFWAHAAENVT